MPVVKFTTTDYSVVRGRPIELTADAEYASVVGIAIDRILARGEKTGELPVLDITIDWHPKKHSLDQLALFWSLLDIAASLQADAEIPSPGEIKRLAHALYEDYLMRRAPRAEMIVNEEAELQAREQFGKVVARGVLEDGRVCLSMLMGASTWTIQQMSQGIDYWMNELASVGVDLKDESSFANYWREWKMYLAGEGVDIIDPNANITPEEYRLRTPIAECCGCWLGREGEIAHIEAKGMGGEVGEDKPWRWLHLCYEHHRGLQHQKGWADLIKIAPWLRPKVERALGRKVR